MYVPREIAPIYHNVPDRQAAEAFSEPLLHPRRFKSENLYVNGGLHPGHFPPEPAWPTAVVAAYFNDDSEITRHGTVAIPANAPYERSEIVEALGEHYQEHVGRYQAIAETLPSTPFFDMGRLALSAAEKAHAARLRTVAAFCLYSARDSRNHYGGMVLPKKAFTELPIDNRQDWLGVINGLKPVNGAKVPNGNTQGNEGDLERVLANDPQHSHLVFMVVAQHLPRPGAVRQLFR